MLAERVGFEFISNCVIFFVCGKSVCKVLDEVFNECYYNMLENYLERVKNGAYGIILVQYSSINGEMRGVNNLKLAK